MTETATSSHLIDGEWMSSTSNASIDVLDPSTGAIIGRIPAGTPADASAAVAAARKAQEGWARFPVSDRAAALKVAARMMRENIDELAVLQTSENGKPLEDSRSGVMAGIQTLEQYAELGPLHRSESLAGKWMTTDMMVHEPRGVAVLLVPWNDPLAIACGMIGATLVTGNTVVFKPSEKTPLSAIRMVELFELPTGVLNLALGDARIGRPLVGHPGVDLVMHTGSISTGREIAGICGSQLKKAVLELGGKDPLIVDEGVDPEWAAEQAASGAFANTGQVCTSVERIYAHASVAEDFVQELVRRAESLTVGDGMNPETQLGPLIDERQREIVHRHVQEALEAGATLLTGGEIPEGPGFFYPPTVLTDVTDDMTIMRDETFGPVAAVKVVESFNEALAAANGTEYGLAATVLTPSQVHAQRAWRELEAGTVKINSVWGGAPGGSAEPHKQSGLGFGYGPKLLDEVTTTKVVHYAAVVSPNP